MFHALDSCSWGYIPLILAKMMIYLQVLQIVITVALPVYMTLAMAFDNVSKLLRYITWPVELGARLIIEFLLGIVLGV